MVTNGCTRFAKSDDLGVGRRVRGGNVAIPSNPHHSPLAHYDCAHRNLSRFQTALSTAQGLFHPQFVGTGVVGDGVWVFKLGRFPGGHWIAVSAAILSVGKEASN
jgi:hypothetical protein